MSLATFHNETSERNATSDAVGIAVVQFAEEMLARHRAKAKRHREKNFLTLYQWLLARRVRKLGRTLGALSDANSGVSNHVAQSMCALISQARLSPKLKGEVTGAVVKKLLQNGATSAAAALADAMETGTIQERLARFSVMQAISQLDSALACGEELVNSKKLSAKQLNSLLREPAMLLAARKLLVEKAEFPAWATSGKIAYVAASSLPYNVTGYTTRTHGVAQGYKQNGFDVHVVTRPSFPLNFHPTLDARQIPELERLDGIPYHRLLEPNQKQHTPVEWIRLAADVIERKLRDMKPEIVVAASNYMNSLPALIAARRLGLPFAYEVRGMWELTRDSRDPGFSKTADFAVTVLLEDFVAQNADSVLTLTEPMRIDLIQRGVEPQRIDIMPNGVNADAVFSPPRDQPLASRLGIPFGIPVIGYVGSIIDYEGLPDLALACVGLAESGYDFRLLIVGDEGRPQFGGTPITDEIRAFFKAAGIEDRLIMQGRVPFSEVASFYSLIDIAPIPRRPYKVSEMVSPIKPIEALAMGKVLIVSSVEAMKDFTQQGKTGLAFEKGNIRDLQAKLQKALHNPALRETLKQNAQEFVRNNRTWPAICKRAAKHMTLEVGQ
ncbi:glycosyltransferase [Rhizobium sp. P32RR-XVIII]|uniref:glycosyltransferase family 4 protein n=1 Tax=Rhizobium sp. P32RR-XVIII TaxID=2726738 RepID=UPI0014568910|nr:glycosyltransferase family 4 protein [Rhizobium sp. P32RR-XVIII]NLS07854.1 glycosyltransferase [Rhizobium sp. P32RR-XVIII]